MYEWTTFQDRLACFRFSDTLDFHQLSSQTMECITTVHWAELNVMLVTLLSKAIYSIYTQLSRNEYLYVSAWLTTAESSQVNCITQPQWLYTWLILHAFSKYLRNFSRQLSGYMTNNLFSTRHTHSKWSCHEVFMCCMNNRPRLNKGSNHFGKPFWRCGYNIRGWALNESSV